MPELAIVERGRLALRASIRRAPLGVLVLAALFAIVGFGLVGGGLYLVVTEPTARWWAAASSLVVGPMILYLAYGLLRLAHWTWLTLLLVGGLLLFSSLSRIILASGLGLALLVEIGAILTALGYLNLPAVRRSFGWG